MNASELNLELEKTSKQNTNSDLSTCQFPAFNTNINYYCYEGEVCCEHGCCIKSDRHFYQCWYYWFGLIVAFVFLSFIRYMYKRAKYKKQLQRLEQERAALNNNLRMPNMYFSNYILTPPNMYGNNIPVLPSSVRLFGSLGNNLTNESEIGLNQLIACTLNSDPPGYIDPPDYESLSMEKDENLIQPPPKYSALSIREEIDDNKDVSNKDVTSKDDDKPENV